MRFDDAEGQRRTETRAAMRAVARPIGAEEAFAKTASVSSGLFAPARTRYPTRRPSTVKGMDLVSIDPNARRRTLA
jgi:hypothetical protein